jgi:hypothetical protein
MRVLLKIVLVLLVVYAAAVVGLMAAMRQPPATFGRIMAKMPGPAFMVLPFQTLWFNARGGRLRPGDPAPDFSLPTLDRQSRVQLSSFRGKMPVVLVFGSYT